MRAEIIENSMVDRGDRPGYSRASPQPETWVSG
jgi:hypothetical protein